jgi:hypothetical protein
MRQQILPNKSGRKFLLLIALLLLTATSVVRAQTTTFTYQGRLSDGGTPASGSYDLQFALFDSASAGTQIGSTQTAANVSVSAGVFTVQLDFGTAALSGADRFLEISVRLAGGAAFTTLASRQQITSTPYAVRSANATAADVATNAVTAATSTNALQLGGVAANQYVITTDARMTDARTPSAGSASYVQNRASQQASTNFNISGDGTAGGTLSGNLVNATTQYNIGGGRVLSINGIDNLFAGIAAGRINTTGNFNSFVGGRAGFSNTTGFDNSFFGRDAGFSNTTGVDNSFVGSLAGLNNTTGFMNSFVGFDAGYGNTTGVDNSFVGAVAGSGNTTGNNNSFFGQNAGLSNTTGGSNSFVGKNAGQFNTIGSTNSFVGEDTGVSNTSGNNNSFVGSLAGGSNTTGSSNTILGYNGDVGSPNLTFATALGAGAVVSTSNTIALGRPDGSDFVLVPGFLTIPNLAVAGSTQLCRNAFNRVGTCSSSLRYKTDLAPYRRGLSVVNRLRPISFTWKDGGLRDLGFGAEDVEKIDPLLVTYNKEGQVEGVKYDRINVVLVNALKEQQEQIQAQQRKNEEQQRQIESLKRLVCLSHPRAAICK